MKKILLLILSLVLLLSLCACGNKEDINDQSNEMFQFDDSGETYLTEEYQSYIASVQSQLNKKYNTKFIYNYATDVNLDSKQYVVNFTEENTNITFNCECVRNNISGENYLRAKKADSLRKTFEETILSTYYTKGLNMNHSSKNTFVNVDFEIIGGEENIPENVLGNKEYKKILKVLVDTQYMEDNVCDDSLFSKVENNLRNFSINELAGVNNFEIIERFLNCGTVKLYRDSGDSIVTIIKDSDKY